MARKGIRTGKFTPRNPKKYIGDINNITYRSSWELTFMRFLDNNTTVIQWGSEIISIPYIKPTTGRIHKYYPDFWVKYKDGNGKILQELIEVKPYKESKKPSTVGKNKKNQLYEALTWSINKAKWAAAKRFCDKYKIGWRVVTEKGIYK